MRLRSANDSQALLVVAHEYSLHTALADLYLHQLESGQKVRHPAWSSSSVPTRSPACIETIARSSAWDAQRRAAFTRLWGL